MTLTEATYLEGEEQGEEEEEMEQENSKENRLLFQVLQFGVRRMRESDGVRVYLRGRSHSHPLTLQGFKVEKHTV